MVDIRMMQCGYIFITYVVRLKCTLRLFTEDNLFYQPTQRRLMKRGPVTRNKKSTLVHLRHFEWIRNAGIYMAPQFISICSYLLPDN